MNPFATATELLAALRDRTVTATELTEMYIARIETHDGRLNAVVERDFERARHAARAADQGSAGKLRGLPIALKESRTEASEIRRPLSHPEPVFDGIQRVDDKLLQRGEICRSAKDRFDRRDPTQAHFPPQGPAKLGADDALVRELHSQRQ